MPGPLAALLVGQGVKSAYQFGKGKGWWGKAPPGRKQSSQEALYGEELKRRTKEGTLSPAVQMAIKNKALQSSYGAAQRGATDISARLSGQGFEGSAIIGEAAKPLYSDAINKAGEVSSDLSIQNEMSKVGAFKDLAAYGAGESSRKYQNALSKYNYKTGAMDQAVGGFADMISSYGQQGLTQQLQQQASQFQSPDEVMKFFASGDIDPSMADYLLQFVVAEHPDWFE